MPGELDINVLIELESAAIDIVLSEYDPGSDVFRAIKEELADGQSLCPIKDSWVETLALS